MLDPCPIYPQYGYLWWLNTDRGALPERLGAELLCARRRRQPDLDRP